MIVGHDPLCPYILNLSSLSPCRCELIYEIRQNERERIAQSIEKTVAQHKYYRTQDGEQKCIACHMWWPCLYITEAKSHAFIARQPNW